MTSKQLHLYRAQWGQLRKKLRAQGWTPTAADAFRSQLTVKALGYEKSSTAFSNQEFDSVLAVLAALLQPGDVQTQIRQLEQPQTRTMHVLEELRKELNLPHVYIEGMATRICHRPLRDCTSQDLVKLIAALNFHKARQAKAPEPTPVPKPYTPPPHMRHKVSRWTDAKGRPKTYRPGRQQ